MKPHPMVRKTKTRNTKTKTRNTISGPTHRAPTPHPLKPYAKGKPNAKGKTHTPRKKHRKDLIKADECGGTEAECGQTRDQHRIGTQGQKQHGYLTFAHFVIKYDYIHRIWRI